MSIQRVVQSIVYKQRDLIFSGSKEIETIDRFVAIAEEFDSSSNRGLGSSKVSFPPINLLRINWRGKKPFHCSFKFVGESIEEIPRGETIPNQLILVGKERMAWLSLKINWPSTLGLDVNSEMWAHFCRRNRW